MINNKLRILFTTDYRNSPSTDINAANFAALNDIDGVNIDFYSRNYENYDVILFMGYDPRIQEARTVKKDLKIGVIDPRPGTLNLTRGADFIIANGIEMREMCATHFSNIYIYYIYPELNEHIKQHANGDKIVIGYHGNKVHLETMHFRIAKAIEALSQHYNVEFRAIYDIHNLGPLKYNLFHSPQISEVYIQWSKDSYKEHLSDIDIGIVPNLIPLNDNLMSSLANSHNGFFSEHQSDYLLRFKATSNPGRIMVFGQLGIPVIADMFPSALQVIRDGYNGMIAAGASGWYRALKTLADSPELRTTLADRFREDFHNDYTIEKLNRGLVSFLRRLQSRPDPMPLPDLLTPLACGTNTPVDLPCPRTTGLKQGLKRFLQGASKRIKA